MTFSQNVEHADLNILEKIEKFQEKKNYNKYQFYHAIFIFISIIQCSTRAVFILNS